MPNHSFELYLAPKRPVHLLYCYFSDGILRVATLQMDHYTVETLKRSNN